VNKFKNERNNFLPVVEICGKITSRLV